MEQLDGLLNEVRLVWHMLVQTGGRIVSDLPVTLAMRAVLEFLDGNGPTTVPTMARSRRVTRQHIQSIVNDLLKQHLVRLTDNPAHKRSALVELTDDGRRLMGKIRDREAGFLAERSIDATPGDFKRARKTLRAVRRALEATSTS